MFEFFAVIGIDDALILGSIGMAAGGASGYMSSMFGNKNAKKAAKLNYKYQLKMAENGPLASVKGLRKAGLNPILAATDGSFSSPTMPSVQGAGTPDVGSSVLGAANLALNAKQTDSNVDLAKTQGDLNNASAFKAFADGITKLKTGGMSGGYGALHSLGVRLGLGDSTTKQLLKSYGFGPDVISAPDGSVRPSSKVRSRNAPDDGKSEGNGWTSGMSKKEKSNYDVLEKKFGDDAVHLYKPADKAKKEWRKNPRSKRSIFVR